MAFANIPSSTRTIGQRKASLTKKGQDLHQIVHRLKMVAQFRSSVALDRHDRMIVSAIVSEKRKISIQITEPRIRQARIRIISCVRAHALNSKDSLRGNSNNKAKYHIGTSPRVDECRMPKNVGKAPSRSKTAKYNSI